MNRLLVVNGPNLNLLGVREPSIYGSTTLAALEDMIVRDAADLGIVAETFQSNHEGAIIDRLHEARGMVDGIVINAGAFTHYSYAIHDALVATDLPAIEVHISNIHAREPWRRVSVTGPACRYVIFGRGLRGYRDAMIRLTTEAMHPPTRIAYREGPDQFGELRLPAEPGLHPIAVLIHGGFWRDPYTLDLMDRLAVDLTRRGWATWNIEYRRVGDGGGVPSTFEDVAAALDHVASLDGVDPALTVVIGHSAGGHLALWAAGTARRVVPIGAVSLAGITDLEAARAQGLGNDAVADLIGASVGDRHLWSRYSPAHMPQSAAAKLLVHGSADDRVPIEQSKLYLAMERARSGEIDLIEGDGVDHFELIDPASELWQHTAAWLERLLGDPRSIA
jgi:3-dehydroquinate dehydratase type II